MYPYLYISCPLPSVTVSNNLLAGWVDQRSNKPVVIPTPGLTYFSFSSTYCDIMKPAINKETFIKSTGTEECVYKGKTPDITTCRQLSV